MCSDKYMPSIVWKGQLTFGLISIPVKLYRAARRERVRLHYVHRTAPETDMEEAEAEAPPMPSNVAAFPRPGALRREPVVEEPEPDDLPEAPPPEVSRVRQSLVAGPEERPISRSELSRGYEVEKDRYVVFEPQELRGLQRRTSSTMDIVRSVLLSGIDPIFFETSYYLAPDKGGDKPYAILFAALKATGHVALARVGMHGREHVIIVRPGRHGMIAHTMFYVDEVRFENETHADVSLAGDKELDLAKTFLKAMEAPFAPEEFKNEYRAELESMIAKKTASLGPAPAMPLPAAAAPPAVDILEALRQSIAMAKKPVASEQAAEPEPARKSPARVTEIKSKKPARKAR